MLTSRHKKAPESFDSEALDHDYYIWVKLGAYEKSSQLLDKIYSTRVNQLNNLDKQWKKKYLEQNFPRLTVEQLKNWKEEVVRMPGYLTSETIAQIESTAATVNALLIRKKVDYIVSLINDLNAEERKELLKSLSQN